MAGAWGCMRRAQVHGGQGAWILSGTRRSVSMWSFTTAMFVLAIPATAMMVVLWYALLASAPLNSLNSFTFLTPVFGLAIGMLLFGETFTSLEMIGIGITIVGLVIVVKAPGKTDGGSAVGEEAKVIRSS